MVTKIFTQVYSREEYGLYVCYLISNMADESRNDHVASSEGGKDEGGNEVVASSENLKDEGSNDLEDSSEIGKEEGSGTQGSDWPAPWENTDPRDGRFGGPNFKDEQFKQWREAVQRGDSPFDFMKKFMDKTEEMDEEDIKALQKERERMREKWRSANSESKMEEFWKQWIMDQRSRPHFRGHFGPPPEVVQKWIQLKKEGKSREEIFKEIAGERSGSFEGHSGAGNFLGRWGGRWRGRGGRGRGGRGRGFGRGFRGWDPDRSYLFREFQF